MKIGVKVGPANWKQVLSVITPECAEVWFRLGNLDNFDPIFSLLVKKSIPFGIHFWAVTADGFEPNLSYEKAGVADETVNLMQETISIAHSAGASYVNIHPGSLMLKKLDLDNKSMKAVPGTRISSEEAYNSLKKRVHLLDRFARSKNIDFLVETLPKNDQSHWRDSSGRDTVQHVENIGIDKLVKLAGEGIQITNDIGHTLSAVVSQDRKFLVKQLVDATKKLASQTRLIHLNTVIPPFNGSDSHDGVLPEDFKHGVLPQRETVLQILRLFNKREDVWIVPEPHMDTMIENYRQIQKLVNQSFK